jgi:cyanophycin synthetase
MRWIEHARLNGNDLCGARRATVKDYSSNHCTVTTGNRQDEDADMRIEDIRTLNGANSYHHASVLVMTLDQEELAGKETHEVTGFMDQLLTLLPGIIQHHCASGRADGVVEPTPPPIGFDHITARVALELATLASVPVHHASVLYTGGPECCQIVIEFTNEAGMRFLLHTAVELVEALIKSETPPLEDKLAEARALIEHTAPESSVCAIVLAARGY